MIPNNVLDLKGKLLTALDGHTTDEVLAALVTCVVQVCISVAKEEKDAAMILDYVTKDMTRFLAAYSSFAAAVTGKEQPDRPPEAEEGGLS